MTTQPAIATADLITRIAAHTETPKAEVRRLIEALAAVAQSELAQGRRVRIPGLGALAPSWRPARSGTAPNGKAWATEPHYRVAFKPSPDLRTKLSGAQAESGHE